MPDHQDERAPSCFVDQRPRLGGRDGHRLLDQDVATGPQRGHGDLMVARHRCGDTTASTAGIGKRLAPLGQ